MDELITAMKEHGTNVLDKMNYEHIMYVNLYDVYLALYVDNIGYTFNKVSYEELFKRYHFRDNTPCGKEAIK